MTVPAGKWKKQELINQVQALEDKLNALITAYNAHVHIADAATTSTVTELDLSV